MNENFNYKFEEILYRNFGIILKNSKKENNNQIISDFIRQSIKYTLHFENPNDFKYILPEYLNIIKENTGIKGIALRNNPDAPFSFQDYVKTMIEYFLTYDLEDIRDIEKILGLQYNKDTAIKIDNEDVIHVKVIDINSEKFINFINAELFENNNTYSEIQIELLNSLIESDYIEKFKNPLLHDNLYNFENKQIIFFSLLLHKPKTIKGKRDKIIEKMFDKNIISQFIQFSYNYYKFIYYNIIDIFETHEFFRNIKNSPNFSLSINPGVTDKDFDSFVIDLFKAYTENIKDDDYKMLQMISYRKPIIGIFNRLSTNYNDFILTILRNKRAIKIFKQATNLKLVETCIRDRDVKTLLEIIKSRGNYNVLLRRMLVFLEKEENVAPIIDFLSKHQNDFKLKYVLQLFFLLNFYKNVNLKNIDINRLYNVKGVFFIDINKTYQRNLYGIDKVSKELSKIIVNHKNIQTLKEEFENGYKYSNDIIYSLALAYSDRNLLHSKDGEVSPGSILNFEQNPFFFIAWDFEGNNDKRASIDLDLSAEFKFKDNHIEILNYQRIGRNSNLHHTGDMTFCFNKKNDVKVIEGIYADKTIRDNLKSTLVTVQSYSFNDSYTVTGYCGIHDLKLKSITNNSLNIKNSDFYFEFLPIDKDYRILGVYDYEEKKFFVSNMFLHSKSKNVQIVKQDKEDKLKNYLYYRHLMTGTIDMLFTLLNIPYDKENGKEVDLREITKILMEE